MMIVPIDSIYKDMLAESVDQMVAFGRTTDGQIMVWSTHPAQMADDLINDGLEEWDRLLEDDDGE